MKRRPRLSVAEIDALLTAAGDVDAPATFNDLKTKEDEAAFAAFESGMAKLRQMLAAREQRRP